MQAFIVRLSFVGGITREVVIVSDHAHTAEQNAKAVYECATHAVARPMPIGVVYDLGDIVGL